MANRLENRVSIFKYRTTKRYVSPSELKNRLHFFPNERRLPSNIDYIHLQHDYEGWYKRLDFKTVFLGGHLISDKSDPFEDFNKLLPYLEEMDRQISLYYEELRTTFKNTKD